jgi:hypothetical protein
MEELVVSSSFFYAHTSTRSWTPIKIKIAKFPIRVYTILILYGRETHI